MLHIPYIPIITLPDRFGVAQLAMQSFCLRHSRYPRSYTIPFDPIRHQRFEGPAVRQHVRPGSDQAHRTYQYVDQLWQLVQVRMPEPCTQLRDTPVADRHRPPVRIVIDDHASQLVANKQPSASAHSFLDEKNRPPGVQPDQQGQRRQEPAQEENNNNNRYGQVEKPLHLMMNGGCAPPVARATDALPVAF